MSVVPRRPPLGVWRIGGAENHRGRAPDIFRSLVSLYGSWFPKLASPSTHGGPRTPASLSPSGGACGTAWAVHTAIGFVLESPEHTAQCLYMQNRRRRS